MLNLTTIKLALLGVAALAIVGVMTVWYVQKERAQAASVEALAHLRVVQHQADQLAANANALSEAMGREQKANVAAGANLRAARAEAATKAAQLADAIKREGNADARLAACFMLDLPIGVLRELP